MMILPKFENPESSADMLRDENERLIKQANKMLEHTKILDVLAKYGKVSDIGGSYLYNLMVYPDLDLNIVTEKVSRKTASSLVAELIKAKNVRGVNFVDTYSFGSHSGKPKGYWLGVEVPFEHDRWGIDCWLQQPNWLDSNGEEYTQKLSNIDQSSKDSILMLKYQLIYRGLYGRKYYSGQVYDAVIKNGPLSIDQFLSLNQ